MRVRARLEKLVRECRARKVRSVRRGQPYAYEPVEIEAEDAPREGEHFIQLEKPEEKL